MKIILLLCWGIVNLVGFAIMGIDKSKAIHKQWRVPEKMLFLIALVGGGVGATFGMHFFHHKTKHWYFRYGFPLIAIAQLILAKWIMEVI